MILLIALSGVGFLVSVTAIEVNSPREASSSVHRSQDEQGNYKFGYSIEDGWGSSNGRWEVGDANGNKRGGYTINDADGRKRYVEYVADEKGRNSFTRAWPPKEAENSQKKHSSFQFDSRSGIQKSQLKYTAGFRVVVNTNEPGTAPSHTGSTITKPAETSDEIGDETLLQSLAEKRGYDASDEKAQFTLQERDHAPKNHYDVVETSKYPNHDDFHANSYQPEILTGASASATEPAAEKHALHFSLQPRPSSLALHEQGILVPPVPVRDIPGYITSSSNKFTVKEKAVYGENLLEPLAVDSATHTGNGIQHNSPKHLPLLSSGWSSKKEFYRDYLKKKYANQRRVSIHPKQVTVEHLEPVDPKVLLSFDRRYLPIVYSNLKHKLAAEDDETALESHVTNVHRLQNSSANSIHEIQPESTRPAEKTVPIVSSEPVFPVRVDPIRLPSSRYPLLSHHAIVPKTNFRYALTKRTGFAPRKVAEVDEQKQSPPNLKDRSQADSRETDFRNGGSGRNIYSYF